jgi:hypothetical protein
MIHIFIKKLGESEFTDRTNQVRSYSLALGTTKEASTGTLTVNAYGSKYVPDGEDAVEFWDGDPDDSGAEAERIFSGYLIRVSQRVEQGPTVVYECDLKNKVHLLDRKLVNVNFENETAHDIIENIVTNFSGAGITTDNVEDDAGAVVTSIVFNNVPPSEAIQQIADLFGKEWYIDEDGDIHFFSKLSEEAPFELTDTNGKAIFESIEIVRDYTQIKNSILVEGGKEKSTSEEYDTFVADGEQHTFQLSREYTGLVVTEDSTTLSVGIANINTFATHDCLYDFNLRSLYFDPASPPSDGTQIVAGGKYYFPILVRFRESGSIATYGERQFFIQDNTIKSRTDAISRASAEIASYARNVSEGSFTTLEAGLKPGQKITINSTIRGVNEGFVIQRVSGSPLSPSKIEWKIEIVSMKSYELIDLLAEIIRGRRKESPADAVIGVAERVEREIGTEREILTYFNDPPTWVAGPWPPVSLADRRRVPFTDRDCMIE